MSTETINVIYYINVNILIVFKQIPKILYQGSDLNVLNIKNTLKMHMQFFL